MPFVLHKIR